MGGQAKKTLDQVLGHWNSNKPLLESLLIKKDKIVALKEQLEKLDDASEDLMTELTALQRLKGVSPHDMIYVQELLQMGYRIHFNLEDLFSTEAFSLERGYNLLKDLRFFNVILKSFRQGNDFYGISPLPAGVGQDSLARIDLLFREFFDLIPQIDPMVTTLNNAKEMAGLISTSSKLIGQTTELLEWNLVHDLNTLKNTQMVSIILYGVSLVC